MSKKQTQYPLSQGPRPGKPTDISDESAAVRREGFESIIVAILLALLFRGFEAEAFIIPTGSMAPTLQGMHKDLRCPKCDYRYRVNQPDQTLVVSTTCPMCRFETEVNKSEHPSYNGDRIMVNKFAYEIGEPKRWDVIVFKFPGNAKQNYIKRLVGMPGETLRISGGDVFARPDGESEFRILRRPVEIIPHVLQLVHDTRYIPSELIKGKWPARWHAPNENESSSNWVTSEDRGEYKLTTSDEVAWLRYRHLPPVNRRTQNIVGPFNSPDQWSEVATGKWPQPKVRGRLIRDWYAYNNGENRNNFSPDTVPGWHWVGDLAIEANLNVTTDQGEMWLDLVESGENYRCHIDVGTGKATVALPDGTVLNADTGVKGKGTYRLLWSNLDDQVVLWVNRKPVTWMSGGEPHPGHYMGKGLAGPEWSEDEAGDLLPAGIGGRNIGIVADKLKIYRDVYYTAAIPGPTLNSVGKPTDYETVPNATALQTLVYPPANSADCESVFADRRSGIEFTMEKDQFFPMGDNSPQSKDGRLWALNGSRINPSGQKKIGNYVERDLLIGKAIIVYWPHGWPIGPLKLPINPIPNVDRMGKIR